ncbi:hypothetical protein F7734_17660 [Scytonema sp. UIC 10036]|uniref:hypothetical protein n=1 Tax=Scytonema sp. UIC 10036 TaxID=2304196 RepID=UPI0012DAEC1A|nr:hypothetical protein [Scytonema sp. UIC 10036]MUG94117.1 hypothetical protein [Scytonema sp. UIC 10036]
MYNLDHQQVIHLPPDELVVHPRLIEIYGEDEDRPLLSASIQREMRILVPIEVSARTGVNVVIAGKCRLQIAKKLGFATVPVFFGEYSGEEEELKALYDFNIHREEKTHFQRFIEGAYWEPQLKEQAKERQRENARRLNDRKQLTKCSNLNTSSDDISSQESRELPVLKEVAKKVKLSVGSYHKGKKVYEFISQLKDEGKLRSVAALQQELNRSIDTAYKFVRDERREKVLDAIERGEVNTIREGNTLVRTGSRNPWRKIEVGQVYLFKKEPRPDFFQQARVIKITNEFVIFAFRNSKTNDLETISLRPSSIDATLQEEPSVKERARILRLLEKFGSIYPLRVALTEMLKITNLTMEEERFLAYLETGKYEEMIREREIEFEIARNENTKDCCAA